jgi:hypothetical protein
MADTLLATWPCTQEGVEALVAGLGNSGRLRDLLRVCDAFLAVQAPGLEARGPPRQRAATALYMAHLLQPRSDDLGVFLRETEDLGAFQ